MSKDELAPRASLDVEMPRSDVSVRSSAEARITLKNDDKRPLWVNGRLLVNSVHAPKPYRELHLVVVNPSGAQLDFQLKVRAGQASRTDYHVLGPGESLSVSVDLSECFDLTVVGAYSVVAVFEDGTDPAPPAPGQSILLRGPVQSAKKEFRIVDR